MFKEFEKKIKEMIGETLTKEKAMELIKIASSIQDNKFVLIEKLEEIMAEYKE